MYAGYAKRNADPGTQLPVGRTVEPHRDPRPFDFVDTAHLTRAQLESKAFRKVTEELCFLHDEKNARYGRNLPRHGIKGVTIRLADKMQRLENMVMGGIVDTADERLDDTLRDIAGYAAKTLSLMYLGDITLDGDWREANGMEKPPWNHVPEAFPTAPPALNPRDWWPTP